MSSLVQLNPSGEMEAKIIELKNIMQTRRGFNKSKAKLTNTFGGSKNHRYMFNRSNSNFGITDKFNKQTHSIKKGNYSMWNAPNNNKHPDILKLLREIMHLKDPDFRYSTIQINAPVLVNRNFESNTVSQWHKDTGNMRNAQSYGFSFGDFECNSEPTTGAVGDLWTRDEDGNITVIDYHNKPTKFDAQKVEHRTNPNIEGKRWAVLYFTSEHAIEIDVVINYEYLILKDTTQQEPQYLQWLNDVPNLSQQHRDYIRANEDEFKRVYETRQLKLQEDKYQIKTDKKFVIWKKLNLFVINLERCPEKRNHMNKNLKQEGFTNYAFFEAVDGLKLVEDPAYTYDYKDTKLINQKVFRSGFNTEGHYDCIGPTGNAGHSWKKTPVVLGEIGCVMSHFDIWKHAWDNDFSNVMVMEDDVNFDHDFFDFDCFQIPHDVELIQLGWEGKGSKNGPNLNKLYYKNVEQSNPFGHFIEYDKDHSIVLNHCYIIPNRDALKKLIDLYKPYYPGSMDEPATKLQNHAFDIVMDKIVYPQLNMCLLKDAIKQKRKQGIFRSDIRGSHIKNHQFESKEQVNDDETKGDDNNNNIEVAMPKKLPSGDSLVTAMDDPPWDSEPTEYIYIGFLVKDGNMKGGWRSMTAHLYHCLKYYYDEKIINIKPIVVRTHGSLKTGLIGKNKTDFGYGITSERMSIHDLARKKNVLLMAVGKNGSEKKGGKGYSDLELFKGHSIVVHDINEVTRYVNAKNNRNYLKDMKVIVLGQHLKEVLLKNYGITSKLIKQPFYQFPTYNVEKTNLISTARVDGRKNHNIILEANHVASEHLLVDNTPGEEHLYRAGDGLIRIRSALAPKAKMQTISKYTEDQKKQFKACYEGGFDMSFEATAKTYADALALVDMSMFKAKQGDGGRTQYTFLEAIHCDCMLILHDTWLKYPGPFTKGVNCQTIANAEELASLSCKLAYDLKKVYYDVEDGKLVPYSYEPNEVKEFGKENEPNLLNFVYDHYVSNAKKILPQHDNGHVWMNNILKSYHEFYSKAVEKELPEPEVAVQSKLPFIKDLFNAKPIVEPHFHGWLGHGNKKFLKQCVEDTSIKVIVELGSWYGKSAQYMMKTATHDLTLICVDIWSAQDIESGNQVIKNEKFGDMVREHPLYQNFISNLWDYADKVIPIKDTTINGLKLIHEKGIEPDVIYIDANHTYNDVKAEITLSRQLFPFAIICGDDWNWSGVERAVKEMAETLQVDFNRDQNFWMLETRVNTEEVVEEELPESEVAVKEELPESEVAVEEELPTGGDEIIADIYGIQDPRCASNDMWGTPPEFKTEHGYDKTWFDPCPYPPAEWDATEVDWFKFKDCKKNGNKFFVNPPYKKQFRIPFFKKIVETFKEAKEKNLDIKIHCLIPSDFPTYMKPYMEESTGYKGLHGRPHFTNLLTGVVAGSMRTDSMLVFYEHTKVLKPINHTNDDIVIVNKDEEEDDHEVEFDPTKCYVGGLGSVKLSKKKPDFDYQHYQELRGLKKKKSEIKPEVKLVNVKNDSLPVDLKKLRLEREQRRGVPSYKRSEMANDNNNNNRIMKYDDIGKKIKKKKKTSWRSLGKGESLKGNVVEADPIIGQKILWKGDDGEDWLGKIVSYTRRKYEIKFDDFEDDGNKLVSKSAAQQLIQFYKDKYK